MKNLGSYFEYEEARNKDLMRAYHDLLSRPGWVYAEELYRTVVEMPSERFWVSEERASIVMGELLHGKSINHMRPTSQEKYLEIYRRLVVLKEQNPEASIYSLTSEIVNSPAPKFYLTPQSAKVIISKIKSQWYEERKHKYRHLFM